VLNILGDHAPHERLTEWSGGWPLLLGAIAAAGLVWISGSPERSDSSRVGVGVVVGLVAMLPASLAGYCSRPLATVAVVFFSLPALYGFAHWTSERPNRPRWFWLVAFLCADVYFFAVTSECWADSYAYGEGPAYPMLLALPLVAVSYGAWRFCRPARQHASQSSGQSAQERAAQLGYEKLPAEELPPTVDHGVTPLITSAAQISLAKRIRLLLAPLLVVSALMLPTLLLTLPGLAFGGLSFGTIRGAGRVIRGTDHWTSGARQLLRALLAAVALLTAWWIGWGTYETLNANSDWHSPWTFVFLVGWLAWATAVLTTGTKVLRTERARLAQASAQ